MCCADNAIQGQSVTIEAFGGHRSIQLCQVEVFEEEVFKQGQSAAVKLENPDANTGKYCEPANDIKTEAECRVAAASIDGIAFNLAYNGPHDHAYCFFLHGSVYFNTASKETSRTLPRPDAQSICAQSIGSCYDGQIKLNHLSALGASKGLSSEHNIIKGYRNMEACNECIGPGACCLCCISGSLLYSCCQLCWCYLAAASSGRVYSADDRWLVAQWVVCRSGLKEFD